MPTTLEWDYYLEHSMSDITGGSVSSGTMRPEDLIPAFMAVLEEHDPRTAAMFKKTSREVFNWLDHGDDEPSPEQVGWLLEDLFDALDLLAPAGHYFGAHEGDGADYGFWEATEFEDRCLYVVAESSGVKTYCGASRCERHR